VSWVLSSLVCFSPKLDLSGNIISFEKEVIFGDSVSERCGGGTIRQTVDKNKVTEALRAALSTVCPDPMIALNTADSCEKNGVIQIAMSLSSDKYHTVYSDEVSVGHIVKITRPCR